MSRKQEDSLGDVEPIDAPDRRRLPLLLRHAWYGLNQAFRRRIMHLGLTPDQFTVMRTLLEQEGLTQTELSRSISSDPNTVAALLARMERAGLLERAPDRHDRRVRRLRLKAPGRRKYEEARQIAVELQSEVLSVLPAEQRESFLAQLDLIAGACRKSAGRTDLEG
jgi:DNA-binding MarR family transcriptional regulator